MHIKIFFEKNDIYHCSQEDFFLKGPQGSHPSE